MHVIEVHWTIGCPFMTHKHLPFCVCYPPSMSPFGTVHWGELQAIIWDRALLVDAVQTSVQVVHIPTVKHVPVQLYCIFFLHSRSSLNCLILVTAITNPAVLVWEPDRRLSLKALVLFSIPQRFMGRCLKLRAGYLLETFGRHTTFSFAYLQLDTYSTDIWSAGRCILLTLHIEQLNKQIKC